MAASTFCTCVMLTVLSTSQIILGYPLTPIIARDPRDHHIYSPPIQYATDLFKNNLFDYSNFFPDYDYQSGTRNPVREYTNNNNNQKQQGLGYTYYQHSPNQQEIGNQGSQTSENSPKQGLGTYQLALPNALDYNNDQTMNAIPNLLGMLPFVGEFFSPQPSHSQQATYGGQSKYNTNANHLHKPISKVHTNPSAYQTVPISKPNNPNIPMTATDQSFLQTLASNPALLSQLQTLLQAQNQGVPQASPGQLTGSLQTPNSPSAPLKTNSQTQGTAPPTVPVATAEASNPSQTLTTPRPSTDTLSVPSPPKGSLSAQLTPSGNQLPALPVGNVPLSSSLPAPSPVTAPPLAVPSVSAN